MYRVTIEAGMGGIRLVVNSSEIDCRTARGSGAY